VKPDCEIIRSHSRIHGIDKEWLVDAPSFKGVQAHAQAICSNAIIAVGHGVKHDLTTLGLQDVRYVDT